MYLLASQGIPDDGSSGARGDHVFCPAMSREPIAQQLEEARGAFPDVRALAHEDGEVSFRLEGESLCFF